MNKKNITIALTGLCNVDNPASGMAFIKCIKRSDIFNAKIIGLVYDNMEPGIYFKDLVDEVYLVPDPLKDKGSVYDRIKEIHIKEKIDVLFPHLDAEMKEYINNADRFAGIGIRSFMPTFEQFEERQKENLPEFGEEYGIRVPLSQTISNIEDFRDLKSGLDYPVVVKSKHYVTGVADNFDMAKALALRLEKSWGGPIIIQQYIKGDEFCIAALGDGHGNLMASVTLKKLFYNEKGKIWFAKAVKDKRLTDLAERIIRGTSWRGAMEIELILTPENEIFVYEINPRIPAWIYYAAELGQNIPEELVKLALDMPVTPMTDYLTDKIYVRFTNDMVIESDDFRKLEKDRYL